MPMVVTVQGYHWPYLLSKAAAVVALPVL